MRDEPASSEIAQGNSFRFQGTEEDSEPDSGLAMTPEAGISPPEEDIFESAARIEDDPGFGAPSTGGALAFDEATSGMSVLETHAGEDSDDASDIFAASLEVPAPPIDDAHPEGAEDESEVRSAGPWIDNETQQAGNLNTASSTPSEFDERSEPTDDVLEKKSGLETEALEPETATAAVTAATSNQEASTEVRSPSVATDSTRDQRGASTNNAVIRRLRDWESRVTRGEGG